MLDKMKGPQPTGGGNEQQLFALIQSIPKIKGAVFFEGKNGDTISLVLTDLKDKSTIINKLPPEFKGKIKFRSFVEGQDEGLQAVVDNEEQAPAPPQGPVPAIA